MAEIAQAWNVSRRTLFLALKVARQGDADLVAAVERGEISVSAAAAKVGGKAKRVDRLATLRRAYLAATLEERLAFCRWAFADFDEEDSSTQGGEGVKSLQARGASNRGTVTREKYSDG